MTAKMIAAIFGNMRAHESGWHGPIAAAFDDVANALYAGAPPIDVAIVCRAAADALRHPEKQSEIRELTESRLRDRKS